MRYHEFEAIVEKEGYSCNNHQTGIDVYIKGTHKALVSIPKNVQYALRTYEYNIIRLSPEESKFLLDISVELAHTPLKEREDGVKEVYYRLKFIGELDSEKCYLNISRNGKRIIDTKYADGGYKTAFTESELEDMNEDGFKREEVLA